MPMGDPLPHLCHTAVPPWGSFLVALEFLLSVWVENENEPTEPAQLILSALCLWEKRVLGSVGPGPVQPRGFRRSRRREPGQASDRPSPAPRSVLRPPVPAGWALVREKCSTCPPGNPNVREALAARGGRFEADHSLCPKILWTQATCLSCLSKFPVGLMVT